MGNNKLLFTGIIYNSGFVEANSRLLLKIVDILYLRKRQLEKKNTRAVF